VQIGGAAGTRAQGIIKNDRLIVECGQTIEAGARNSGACPEITFSVASEICRGKALPGITRR
jgi:hypothetical protein